jgi:hypothetical protein
MSDKDVDELGLVEYQALTVLAYLVPIVRHSPPCEYGLYDLTTALLLRLCVPNLSISWAPSCLHFCFLRPICRRDIARCSQHSPVL